MLNFRRLLNQLWEFPCPLCHNDHAQPQDFNSFCPECMERLPLFHGKRCPGCGGELSGALALCSKCLAMPQRPWSSAVSLMAMQDAGELAVYRLKFGRATVMARAFSEIAAPLLVTPEFQTADMLVPVPLHWRRLGERGFNQAGYVAHFLGKKLQKPCVNALKRIRYTHRQATLQREERLKNLQGAFAVRKPDAVRGKVILLVDDVLTTGATLHAAADTLLHAGAAKILVFTVARR